MKSRTLCDHVQIAADKWKLVESSIRYIPHHKTNGMRKYLTSRIVSYVYCRYSVEARTMEPEKQQLLGNGCVTFNNGVTVGSGVFCAVSTEAI
jgi:hypothetical protein